MPTASQTSTALPLYVQISELLIRDIAAGRLIDGERLPPERDMAEAATWVRLWFRYFRLFSNGFILPSISSCISPVLM